MSGPHAVIIAGGEGRRLGGVRKAGLRIGGVRQIERVIAALGGVAVPIVVSTGPSGSGMVMPAGCVAVPDLDAPSVGPLAGLAAAIDWLRQAGTVRGLLVSAAVDTPFLPSDFGAAMTLALGSSAAAYAAWGEDFYPPNAVWRIETLQSLPERVARGDGPTSLKALQRDLGARRVDWAAEGVGNRFRNINTVADLVALQQIARETGDTVVGSSQAGQLALGKAKQVR